MFILALAAPFLYLLIKRKLLLSLLALVLQSLVMIGIWWGWPLSAVFTVAHWLIQSKHPSANRKFDEDNIVTSPLSKVDKEKAEEMASRVNTIAQLKQLEKRLEAAEEKLYAAETEAQERTAQKRFDTIEEAIQIASSKTIAWQFIPDLTLDSPKLYFDKAFNVISSADSENLRQTMQDGCHWLELCLEEEPEQPEIEVSKLKQLKEITLQDKSDTEIAMDIDRYCEAHEDVANYWFDRNTSPSEQWLTQKITRAGFPKAKLLYDAGFKTIEQIVSAPEEEIKAISGIGPKLMTQIKIVRSKLLSLVD